MFKANRNFALCLALIAIEGALSFTFIVWWPQGNFNFFSFTVLYSLPSFAENSILWQHDTFLNGAQYVIYLGTFMVTAPVVGWVSRKTGDAKVLLTIG